MPSVSRLELIARNVLTTLQGVTTGNGFNYTINAVRAEKKRSNEHLDAVIVQLHDEYTDEAATMSDYWWQHFSVVVYYMPKENDNSAVAIAHNKLRADLYSALMADRERGTDDDGRQLAIDTRVVGVVSFPPLEGEFGGIFFEFKVLYSNFVGQPNTAPPG